MEYVRLGTTGLKVSRLCLGMMSYGDPAWRDWVLPLDAARPIVRRAYEAGINFFDTADMYSRGASEIVTGKLLAELAPRRELVVATKVFFPHGDDPNARGLSRKHIFDAIDSSLERLGMDYVDLYQIHRFDDTTPIEETLGALDEVVRSGRARYVGASSMPAWRFAKALGISERRGWHRFVSMQDHYNLLYREEEREMLPLCREEGIGVIPWSPLARGLLARAGRDDDATARAGSDDYTRHLYGDDEARTEVLAAVADVARKLGVPAAQVAIAWLLHQPAITAPIVGATKLAHLEEVLGALDLRLDAEELERLEAPYRPRPVRGHTT